MDFGKHPTRAQRERTNIREGAALLSTREPLDVRELAPPAKTFTMEFSKYPSRAQRERTSKRTGAALLDSREPGFYNVNYNLVDKRAKGTFKIEHGRPHQPLSHPHVNDLYYDSSYKHYGVDHNRRGVVPFDRSGAPNHDFDRYIIRKSQCDVNGTHSPLWNLKKMERSIEFQYRRGSPRDRAKKQAIDGCISRDQRAKGGYYGTLSDAMSSKDLPGLDVKYGVVDLPPKAMSIGPPKKPEPPKAGQPKDSGPSNTSPRRPASAPAARRNVRGTGTADVGDPLAAFNATKRKLGRSVAWGPPKPPAGPVPRR